MRVYYQEVGLEEGFDLALLESNSRIVWGKEVSTCGGIKLFASLRGQEIKCWQCGCVADRWIAERHPSDPARPTLNLFATKWKKHKGRGWVPRLVMMTRDHIIPKSLGGVDDLANLRPGCEICNGNRESDMNEADTAFMLAHPELISAERLKKAEAARRRAERNLSLAKEKKRDQEDREDGDELVGGDRADHRGDRVVDLDVQDPVRLFGEGWRDLLVHPVEASSLPGSEVDQGAVIGVKPTKRELGNAIVGFTPTQIAIWATWIGKRVWKKTSNSSPKPFKSGQQVNTVKGITKHDHTDHFAFTFEEDVSKVECFRCRLYEEPELEN